MCNGCFAETRSTSSVTDRKSDLFLTEQRVIAELYPTAVYTLLYLAPMSSQLSQVNLPAGPEEDFKLFSQSSAVL